MKNDTFNEIFKPILVLCGICLVVSVLVGAANYITAPMIAESKRAAAEAARIELLPDATGFEELYTEGHEYLQSAYKDEGGSGYVITAAAKGYGGDVVCTVAVSPEGEVIGLKVDASTETSGVGSNVASERFVERFIGLTGGAVDVDNWSGATYSSKAVKNAVSAAISYVTGNYDAGSSASVAQGDWDKEAGGAAKQSEREAA